MPLRVCESRPAPCRRRGGGTGGGRVPSVLTADINLHFTGDFHAVAAAHTLSAAIDNHMHHGNVLGIDPVASPAAVLT